MLRLVRIIHYICLGKERSISTGGNNSYISRDKREEEREREGDGGGMGREKGKKQLIKEKIKGRKQTMCIRQ